MLVHCVSGASRSASFVLAYLISEKNMTVEESIDFCRERRPEVSPKPYFLTQLHQYYENLQDWDEVKVEIDDVENYYYEG